MQISTKGRYGLYAVLELAVQAQDKAVALANIAKRQHISLNYLEQVFQALRKADIVKSIKGPNGGYLLNREPADITIKEVLETLEGSLSVTGKDFNDKQLNALQETVAELVWQEMDKAIDRLLEQTTLAQLVGKYKEKVQTIAPMYYI